MPSNTWTINAGPQGTGDANDPWASTSDPPNNRPSLWQTPATQPEPSRTSGIEIKHDSWTISPETQKLWQPPQQDAHVRPVDPWGVPWNKPVDESGPTWQVPTYYGWPSNQTSVNVFNSPWQQTVQVTSPSPMAYPIYQSSPSAPGPQDGRHNQPKDNDSNGGVFAHGASQPVQFVHQTPTSNTQYYCRELNGSWTLRSTDDIMTNCQPGDWRSHSQTCVSYWVRRAAD